MKAFTGPNVISRAVSDDAAEDHRDDVPLAFWDRAGRRTIGRLALAPGATVLDVGCGIGATALPAAERVGPSGRVLGIELCEQLLGRASAQAVARGVGNIDWRSGDLTDLDLPDGRFDAVVCPFAIFFASDMAVQVRRLWRLVRPGGQLALTTWGPRSVRARLDGMVRGVPAGPPRPDDRLQPVAALHPLPAVGSPRRSRRGPAAPARRRDPGGRGRRRGGPPAAAHAPGLVEDRAGFAAALEHRRDGPRGGGAGARGELCLLGVRPI